MTAQCERKFFNYQLLAFARNVMKGLLNEPVSLSGISGSENFQFSQF